jgi:hypothetical protein
VFRFNRRRSRSRGLVFHRVLELAASHEPVRYHELIITRSPRITLLQEGPAGVTHPRWSACQPTVFGEPPDLARSGQVDTSNYDYVPRNLIRHRQRGHTP